MIATTRDLAHFASTLALPAIPAPVLDHARTLILDTLAIAVRARHEADSTASLLAAARRLGMNTGSCHVPGDKERYSPAGAALITGTLAHSLDFDDTHAASSLHPSAPVVPAALAAGEMAGARTADILAGIVAGYEAICRLGLAVDPARHYGRGFHPTATCGTFAAALAAGRTLRLGPESMADALGIALSQSAGSMQYLSNGAWTKRFQVGHAAQAGLVSAGLAAEGFTGAAEALEGENGFFVGYTSDADIAKATAGLGEDWLTLDIAVKPYPSCRYTHASVDAAYDLAVEHDIDPETIESVRIGLPDNGMKLTGEPQEAKRQPSNVVDGQFSAHFCVAVMLRQRGFGWDDYATHLRDQATLALTRQCTAWTDPRAQAAAPRYMAGSAEITLKDGTVYDRFVKICRGEPENRLDADTMRLKAANLVLPILGEAAEARLFSAVRAFEHTSLETLMAASTPPRE